jgi:hypothetical protein
MPGTKGVLTDQQIWSIVLHIRHLGPTGGLVTAEASTGGPSISARCVGSKACQKCHAEIYRRGENTPMANVVRDPRGAISGSSKITPSARRASRIVPDDTGHKNCMRGNDFV